MRQTLNKLLAAIFAVILVFAVAVLPLAAEEDYSPEPPVIEGCKAYYLYNFENDRVLCENGADEVVYPASTVKLMTGIIAAEKLGGELDRTIMITPDMRKFGSSPNLYEGEEVCVKDVLSACLIGGDNVAAMALAYTVSGTVDDFVSLMNEKAVELGAMKTHYTNPTGLHDETMVTTASDTARIAKYAAGMSVITEITASPKHVMEKTNMKDFHTIYNKNCLISKYHNTYETTYKYEPATGMNAGWTPEAGSVLIATAKNKDGDLTYLAVLMGAYSDEIVSRAYEGARTLFEWAFSEWGYVNVLSEDKILCEIPVTLSSAVDHVTLAPKNKIWVYLPTSLDLDKELEYNYTTLYESLAAPVKMGEVAGTATVTYKGELIGSTELITVVEVERSELLYTFAQIEEFTKSRFFIGTAVSAAILTVIYVLVNARVKSKPNGF